MSAWTILLRVLLSIALILNGAVPAMASVHKGSMASAAAVPTQAASAAETPPCHQQHEAAVPLVSDAESTTEPTQSEHPASGCCESGACRCACMHPAPAAMPTIAFIAAMIEHAQSVRPMPSGHAAPALPHLIRPPIG